MRWILKKSDFMLIKTVKMSNYGSHGRPQPKRKIITQIDRLTALRERLVKTIKTLKTPFSDAEGLVDKTQKSQSVAS